VTIHQDAELCLASLTRGGRLSYLLKPGRQGWLQVTRGAVTLNSKPLNAGDGAAITDEKILDIRATDDAEILLFDLS
jgi:quercetin 2,3-dioxygenase